MLDNEHLVPIYHSISMLLCYSDSCFDRWW